MQVAKVPFLFSLEVQGLKFKALTFDGKKYQYCEVLESSLDCPGPG